MSSLCFLDVLKMLLGCFPHAPMGIVGWWNLMIILDESMDFNGPKELDDPQIFDDPSYSMIPSYLMINWRYGQII